MTRVIAFGHYPWYEVLDQFHANRNYSSITQENIIVDSRNDTCALLHAPKLERLQFVVDFPQYKAVGDISVDVLTKDVNDCNSPAWTWFVGSSCSSTRFQECYNVGVDKIGGFSRCRVTCVCRNAEYCQILHFKYAFDLSAANLKGAFCEMKLVYGDVNIPYYGIDWTNSGLVLCLWDNTTYELHVKYV